jgi:hypothetical protein
MAKPKLTVVSSRIPSVQELNAIPIAVTAEYELNDKETLSLRRKLYDINKNSVAYRFRTLREAPYLIVWKLRK